MASNKVLLQLQIETETETHCSSQSHFPHQATKPGLVKVSQIVVLPKTMTTTTALHRPSTMCTLRLFMWVYVWCALLSIVVVAAGVSEGEVGVGVIYDSSCPIQSKLYLASWLGFKDAIISDMDPGPVIIDIQKFNGSSIQQVLLSLSNGTKLMSFVSLLDQEQLDFFVSEGIKMKNLQLRIVAVRQCPSSNSKVHLHYSKQPSSASTTGSSKVSIECMNMGHLGTASAVLYRAKKLGTTVILPIVDRKSEPQSWELLEGFRKLGAKVNLEVKDPIGSIYQLKQILSKSGNVSTTTNVAVVGLLIMSKNPKTIARILQNVPRFSFDGQVVVVHSFSPWGIETLMELQESSNSTGTGTGGGTESIYTAQYVGSTEWDNPARRRQLTQFNEFIGPTPLILTAVLSYDAAFRAVQKDSTRLPLSGPLNLNQQGLQVEGTYFGFSPKPSANPSFAKLLQPSDFILEDLITVRGDEVLSYQVATSSLLSKEELLSLAFVAETRLGCLEQHLEITTHDPFNQLAYTYHFQQHTLPEYLLLPNQYGYGLELSCMSKEKKEQGHEVTSTSVLIACTPNGMSFQEPVHCFRSNPQRRVKRETTSSYLSYPSYDYQQNPHWGRQKMKRSRPKDFGGRSYSAGGGGHIGGASGVGDGRAAVSEYYYPRSAYYSYNSNPIARDDNANNLYYQPPNNMQYYETPAPAYEMPDTSGTGGGGYMDSSTSGYLTTHDIPINEEPASPTPAAAPPPPQPSKLPELRQVLKAAKPFVGSCIGSTTGCAMCVLVLGRLPLGAVPAACTGPCFVGTFGSCGSLLGRVFSETTIICTELFKQGHLDIGTFIADAEFGRVLAQNDPITLKGYQFLAYPLVQSMRSSHAVTSVVARIASSWAAHMKYLVGHSNGTNRIGSCIHSIGTPICNGVGRILSYFDDREFSTYEQKDFHRKRISSSRKSWSLVSTVISLAVTVGTLLLVKRHRQQREVWRLRP